VGVLQAIGSLPPVLQVLLATGFTYGMTALSPSLPPAISTTISVLAPFARSAWAARGAALSHPDGACDAAPTESATRPFRMRSRLEMDIASLQD
jgi:hypothetical protein